MMSPNLSILWDCSWREMQVHYPDMNIFVVVNFAVNCTCVYHALFFFTPADFPMQQSPAFPAVFINSSSDYVAKSDEEVIWDGSSTFYDHKSMLIERESRHAWHSLVGQGMQQQNRLPNSGLPPSCASVFTDFGCSEPIFASRLTQLFSQLLPNTGDHLHASVVTAAVGLAA